MSCVSLIQKEGRPHLSFFWYDTDFSKKSGLHLYFIITKSKLRKSETSNVVQACQFSLVDIGPKWAYGQSGAYQKFYCILLLPTSGGILELV